MRVAKWKLAALIAASVGFAAVVGVGTVSAWPRNGPPVAEIVRPSMPLAIAAPVPPEVPIEEAKSLKHIQTAFPELQFTALKDPKGLETTFPKLYGENSITIDKTDDTYRKLLKARLYRGSRESYILMIKMMTGSYQPMEWTAVVHVLDDVRAVTIELWAKDQGELIPRLKELVILAKDWERFITARVAAGTDAPYQLHEANRHRLECEAVLWKALHPKPTK
jgi:hypothetical protein